MIRAFPFRKFRNRKGVALVITLALIVLITACVVAYFSRTISERQVSNGSANETNVELFTQGAAETIIGDLRQEIAAGSIAAAPSPSPAAGFIYRPSNPLNAIPFRVVTSGSIPNLVKTSVSGTAFYSGSTYDTNDYPAPNRAALLPTDSSTSLNGRSVSKVRWNKPLLIPPTSGTDYTPLPSTGYATPDWILVARNNTNPTAWSAALETSATNSTTVIGRYAYNIYDEGGLLDANVAGYPSTSSTTQSTFKPALSYADLTQIGLTQAQVNQLVGWRNYASAAASGTFPNITLPTQTGTNYYNYVLSNVNGFLGISGTLPLNNNQTDRAFASRQQLIQFMLQGIGQGNPTTALINSLQYLGTFSRDLNQPSVVRLQSTNSGKTFDYNSSVPQVLATANGGNNYGGANLDDQVNPSFLGVRVNNSFTRNNGTQALAGDPLVKSRFALNRLAWITYKGPSADVINASGTADANIQALIKAGIPLAYLKLGTDANIQKYFGLTWQSDPNGDGGSEWFYNIHNETAASPYKSGAVGPISKLGDLATAIGSNAREPDFFELLKATINVGSVGKALGNSNGVMQSDDAGIILASQQPYNYNYYLENSVDFQILQIGANIIDQFQPANYPARIVFNDGSGSVYAPHTIVGVVNLPYFSEAIAGILQLDPPAPLPHGGATNKPIPYTPDTSGTTAGPGNAGYSGTDNITDSGLGVVMEIPVIWNPHNPSSPLTNAVGLSATSLRIVADSTTPDQTSDYSGIGSYWSFFSFGSARGRTVQSGPYQYSCNADASSVGDTALNGNPSNSWFADTTQTGAGIGFISQNPAIGHGNQEIDITVTSGTNTFCPEPVMLLRPWPAPYGNISVNTPFNDLNGNKFNVSVPATSLMRTQPAVKKFFVNGGLPYDTPNGANMAPSEPQDAIYTPYLGFYLGAFPLAWNAPASATVQQTVCGLSAEQSCGYVTRYTGQPLQVPPGSDTSVYMTYRMQYLDPVSGSWITYDTKYGKVTNDQIQIGIGPTLTLPYASGSNQSTLLGGFLGQGGYEGYYAASVDPRSSRFGIFWSSTEDPSSIDGLTNTAAPPPGPEMEATSAWPNESQEATGWLDPADGILYSARPDPQAGFYFSANGNVADSGWPFGNPTAASTDGGQPWGWMAFVYSSSGGHGYCGIAPGLLSQNNTDIFFEPIRFYGGLAGGGGSSTPNYFADPDGMVRRAMGAFVPSGSIASSGAGSAATTVGLPMARAFGWNTTTIAAPGSPDPAITNYSGPTKALQPLSQAQSRPYFLHRPFRSVAELGYVFSDTPWRNLDFFTAESGNSNLLDVFCINDETNTPTGLVAGKVNLNTRQAPVLQAVLAGSYMDPVQAATGLFNSNTAVLAGSTAGLAVANALVARTSDTNNIANGTGPLQNVSELVGKWVQSNNVMQLPGLSNTSGGVLSATLYGPGANFYDGKTSYAGFSGGVWDNTNSTTRQPYVNGVENFSTEKPIPTVSGTPEDVYSAYLDSNAFPSASNSNGAQQTAGYIESFREAPIRALANAGQTRVWNLMIDVIAQTGRYPRSAQDLANFVVDGEQRYWVHVAIDRCTGQVLDEQVEVVKE